MGRVNVPRVPPGASHTPPSAIRAQVQPGRGNSVPGRPYPGAAAPRNGNGLRDSAVGTVTQAVIHPAAQTPAGPRLTRAR
ncbi:hypothetical protein GCM10010446_34840 [Streptomyces enissocaesilis]|uniref:Uncharacterized protein n=1 Tax=Streptomyces enissocaesilis TaxID=332589 RepID=A0ABN3XAW6_9ACTN